MSPAQAHYNVALAYDQVGRRLAAQDEYSLAAWLDPSMSDAVAHLQAAPTDTASADSEPTTQPVASDADAESAAAQMPVEERPGGARPPRAAEVMSGGPLASFCIIATLGARDGCDTGPCVGFVLFLRAD